MSDFHQVSQTLECRQKSCVGVFCDIQNVPSIKGKGDLLIQFAESQGRVISKNVYYNSHHSSQNTAKSSLEKLGFLGVDVPDGSKNSADYRLMADCLKLFAPKLPAYPNIIILVLGDWDFAGLISVLKTLGKTVIVFAERGSASPKLINLVGNENFHYVDELDNLVQNKTKSQSTAICSQINYNEAIDCLTEAIKTALSQSKKTKFGFIDRLMRQSCAKYQGFSSICTHDGKKFKNFSQFINAAVKDGKIRKKNEELFLINTDRLAA
ncbi:NYN domain-containing protein [Nodularia harveyana UHCC-0300]|uniref:NYN domain-containing protein n=1 Tax=Nodularia harveyana UHCC-0300 TaxID=2974287 RepID=A0ABU5U8X1_9CYAN|nr:NYN domain-containing protein [Nodularia harveyana]MEA5579942.1 NYN domain-containing protein [Nodularia harveyana UHCC-0300]